MQLLLQTSYYNYHTYVRSYVASYVCTTAMKFSFNMHSAFIIQL